MIAVSIRLLAEGVDLFEHCHPISSGIYYFPPCPIAGRSSLLLSSTTTETTSKQKTEQARSPCLYTHFVLADLVTPRSPCLPAYTAPTACYMAF